MLRGVIRVWRYVVGHEGRETIDFGRLREAVTPSEAVVWVDASSPTEEEVHSLRAGLGISPTVVDALSTRGSAPS